MEHEHGIRPPPAQAAAGPLAPPDRLPRATVWVLAVGCAVAVANLYYSQPLLATMAVEFRVPEQTLGVVSALTQVGYAIGMLLFVPLGDILERRRLILVMLAAVTVALVAVAVAPGVIWLAMASLVLGVATIAPQLLVPLAASLSGPAERGRVVGTVMSGLLIGILLSRTVSGFVAAQFGWRAMYGLAAGLTIALGILLRLAMPVSRPPAQGLSYPELLGSMAGLVRDEPVLRESCLFGGLAFGAFSAFWTTLAFFLAGPPYDYGSDRVGLFGLVGVAGALAASLAGRLADVRSPRQTIGLGLGVSVLAFVLFGMVGEQLGGLVAGVVLMDMGVQGSHISNQTRIFRLRPEVRNRLNTVYMVTSFVGGSAGSALGAWAWARWGWSGVCGVGVLFLLAALAVYAARRNKSVVPQEKGLMLQVGRCEEGTVTRTLW
jgi:predicted MFS family arabinose efflux permease